MSNRRDIQFMHNPHNKATVLDCSFVVDQANGNGLGIRNLKDGGRIASVYMNTANQTANGNPNWLAQGSPFPSAGVIVVNLQDNYNRYLGGYASFASPVSGSPISISGSAVMTVGAPYVIVSMGTTTQAQWVAAGVPSNVTAAVGVSFIAAITGGGTGTGVVEAPSATGSGIDHIEILGDPNMMASNGSWALGAGKGMQIVCLCFKNGVLTAPNNGTVIGMNFYMNNSAQGV